MKTTYLIIPIILLLISCSSNSNNSDSMIQEKVDAELAQMIKRSREKIQEERSVWSYTSSFNRMSNDSSFFATAHSKNLVNLDFPYDGGSSLSLTIRNSNNSLDAYIRISKGQFNSLYRTDFVTVKVDDAEAKKYKVLEANDNSSDILFIQKAKTFLKDIEGSTTLLIEPTFYSYGTFVFEYDMQDFKWEH